MSFIQKIASLFDPGAVHKANLRAGSVKEHSKQTGILLFGAGNNGRLIAARCQKHAIGPLLGFLDDTPDKDGLRIDGVEVFSRQRAMQEFGRDVAVVVCVYKAGCSTPKLVHNLMDYGFTTVYPLPDFLRGYANALLPFYFFSDTSLLLAKQAQIMAFAEQLADEHSQETLFKWLRFRLFHQYDEMENYDKPIYFPSFLPQGETPFVFVDCGAYTGDSIEGMLNWRAGKPAETIAFEPDPANFQQIPQRLEKYIQAGTLSLSLFNAAVGSSVGEIGFSQTQDASAHIKLDSDYKVQLLTVDSVLRNCGKKASYIKYDVEGFEKEALIGSQQTILCDKPILAVSLYHKAEDLWCLPDMIKRWQPAYRFYLRAHAEEGMDTVLYAVADK